MSTTLRSLLTRLAGPAVLLVTTLLVAIAISHTGPSAAAAIVTMAAIGVTAALAARYVAVAIRTRRLQIGTRDRRHSESLDRMAAPAHPGTAGRPLPRAPGRLAPTA